MRGHSKMGRPMAFDPKVYSGLVAWYDADNAGSITQVANATSQWNDLSGQNNHAVQATAGNKPTYGTDATTSRKKLSFVRANSSNLVAPDANNLDLSTGMSIFVACNITVSGVANATVLTKDSTTNGTAYGITSDPGGTVLTGGANSNLLSLATHPYTGRALYSVIYDKVNLRTRKNKTQVSTTAYTTNIAANTSGLRIGARVAASTGMDGDIFEILVYNSDIGTVATAAVEDYLKTKWQTP